MDKKSFISNIKMIADDIEVKVIVYLRKQVDYFESQYREYVRLILQEDLLEIYAVLIIWKWKM